MSSEWHADQALICCCFVSSLDSMSFDTAFFTAFEDALRGRGRVIVVVVDWRVAVGVASAAMRGGDGGGDGGGGEYDTRAMMTV